MIDRNLERLLNETARAIRYPPAPDLSARVVSRARVPVRRPGGLLRPEFAVALIAAALLIVAALAISPTRDALARLFGVEGSRIEFLPSPLPGETATPFPTPNPAVTPDARRLSPVEIEALPELVGFAAALPPVAEGRVESSLLFYGDDAVLVHRYPSFELWQSRLEGYASFGKLAPPWLQVQEVEVGEWPGIWLSGGEHYVSYVDERGLEVAGSGRVVQRNTLIWRTDAFFYRIETDLPRGDAIRIAKTLP